MGPVCTLATGLPTGTTGNLEWMARWGLEVISKLNNDGAFDFPVRASLLLHYGNAYAGIAEGKTQMKLTF